MAEVWRAHFVRLITSSVSTSSYSTVAARLQHRRLFSDEKHPFLRILCGGVLINTNLVGSYNADNVMAAIAVGVHFGVSFEDAVKAIEAYVPSNNRSQMTKTENNTLIVDAYNANPTSMAAALENFSNVSAKRRIYLRYCINNLLYTNKRLLWIGNSRRSTSKLY